MSTAPTSYAEAIKSGASYFPNGGEALPDSRATATCYCGAVQIAFPLTAPGFVDTFVCHCTDCRKITGSMFATNFTIRSTHLEHVRGEANLSRYTMQKTIGTGNHMTDSFCRTCGKLMYRGSDGFEGVLFLRTGTVDDYALHEGVLRPRVEQFRRSRVGWLKGVEGAVEDEGFYYGREHPEEKK